MNYAKPVPRDTGGAPLHDLPAPIPALATYQRANGAVSSIAILNKNTSTIEVSAFGGQGAVIRWVPLVESPTVAPYGSVVASGLGASFDHAIPSGEIRRFVVPKQSLGGVDGGIGSINGLYQRVATVNAGITAASILLTEY